MENSNKMRQPVIIIGLTLALLFIISFIKFEYTIGDFTFRTIDLFSDIKVTPGETQELNSKPAAAPQFIPAAFEPANGFAAVSNFIKTETDKIDAALAPLFLQGVKTPLYGNVKQLSYFFEALKNSRTKTIRVAHFGDSAIEGDLITADIREKMQAQFGGNCVGWLGIITQDTKFRMTTKHTFSDNWESASLYTNNPKGLPLGISGEVAIPKGNSWVQYETTRVRRALKDFSTVKLYYSHAKNSQINYSFDNGPKQSASLKPGTGIQELVLKAPGKARSIRIEFPVAEQAYIYGTVLENEPGVYIDNLPLRGNTGVDLAQLQLSVLKDFARYLDYKLIILEFGLNIAGSRKTDYTWYEREMVKVINHLKEAFPKTSFVMISVHDKSMKKGSSFVTDPTILTLLETQKRIAKQADVALWSMFDAMGGENSMPKWVNANPPLAFKDYIHFNDQGAAKIAQLFMDSLMDEYKKVK